MAREAVRVMCRCLFVRIRRPPRSTQSRSSAASGGYKRQACVSACASAGHEAILFGDLNNPESDIAKKVATLATRQVRENLDLNTGVRYIGI